MKDLTASSGYIGDYTKTTASDVCVRSSVADPGCLCRISDPGPRIKNQGSKIKDPGSR
jgi:hypothetical protein